MRVLFSSFDATGHVITMLPLASAMRDRGHDVRWATGAGGCAIVGRAGLATVRAGLDNPAPRLQYESRYASEIRALQTPEARRAHIFPKMFGAVGTGPMLADLTPIVRDWKPDLLIHEAGELAGAIAATAAGIPHVTHGFGSLLPKQLVTDAGIEVGELWRSAGLEPRPYAGSYEHLYLDIYPPLMRMRDQSHVTARQLLRPTGEPGPAQPSREPGELPFVYVTFGTVVNRIAAFTVTVDAMRSLEARVLVTVGQNGDPEAFGPLPDHITVERFVPQAEILPRSDLVVSHGGSGTLLGGLAHGIPQLCLPQMADQYDNAEAITAVGAGICLRPEEADRASLEAALRRLLGESSFRSAAERVAADIQAMPPPAEVAAILETRFARA